MASSLTRDEASFAEELPFHDLLDGVVFLNNGQIEVGIEIRSINTLLLRQRGARVDREHLSGRAAPRRASRGAPAPAYRGDADAPNHFRALPKRSRDRSSVGASPNRQQGQ